MADIEEIGEVVKVYNSGLVEVKVGKKTKKLAFKAAKGDFLVRKNGKIEVGEKPKRKAAAKKPAAKKETTPKEVEKTESGEDAAAKTDVKESQADGVSQDANVENTESTEK